MGIDLETTILADFDRAIEATPDERQKAMIRNYREHVRCEETGAIDELMTYLADDAEYHVLGPGAPFHLYGKDAIREHYKALEPHDLIELRLAHVMANDWGISGMLESTVVATPNLLAFAGHPVDDDPSALYQMSMTVAFFRPIEDGLGKAIIYVGGHPTVETVTATPSAP